MKIIVNGYQVEGTPKEISEFIGTLPQTVRTVSNVSSSLLPHTPKNIQVSEPIQMELEVTEKGVRKERKKPEIVPLAFNPSGRRVTRCDKVKRHHTEQEAVANGLGRKGKPVDIYMLTPEGDREFYGSFDTMLEAAIEIDIGASAISKAMKENRTFSNGEGEFYAELSK